MNTKISVLFSIFIFTTLSLFSQGAKMEINWGDGTKPMILDADYTYQEMVINSDAGSQKIYYHPSWMINGNLIHWLNFEKKPEHRFSTSGNYSITITETDSSGNIISSNNSSITIPSQNLSDIPEASTAGIKEPIVNDPVIDHDAGQDFVLPGANNYFEPSYSFLGANITDQKNYLIKNVMWEFKAPWMQDWEFVLGYKVLYNNFLVPSSSLDINEIRNDPFKNQVNYKLVYCYTGNQVANSNVTGSGGQTIAASTFQDYFSQPKTQIFVPVADIVPPNLDPSVLPTDYFATNFPQDTDYSYTTGGKFAAGSYIQVKDENPNLNPDKLACHLILLGQGEDPYDPSKHIVSVALNKPNKFARFPNPTTAAPTSHRDYFSLSRWEMDQIPGLVIPTMFKGYSKLAGKVTGFGPGEPYVTCEQFTVIDDDKPNIFVRFYDLFNGEVRNEHWVTDQSIPEDKIRPELTSPGTDEYRFDFFNNELEWKNSVKTGIIFEDTRTFIELYVIDNISNISGKTIKKSSHIGSVIYTLVKSGSGQNIASGNLTSSSIDSERIQVSPLIFTKPGRYEFVVTATDKARQDENDTTQFSNATNNERILKLELNVTDIQQKSNMLNSSSSRSK